MHSRNATFAAAKATNTVHNEVARPQSEIEAATRRASGAGCKKS
jgi:hypothetical protein